MTVIQKSEKITIDEFASLRNEEFFELENGVLSPRSLSPLSAYVAGQIYGCLHDYLESNPFAISFTGGVGYTLRPDESYYLRKPDASVVLKSRLAGGIVPDSHFEFSPDLAVEVLSPSDVWYEVEAKIREYLNAGTKVVWLANPPRQRITAYLPDGTDVTFGPNDVITAEEVLPGFRMTVRDVFP